MIKKGVYAASLSVLNNNFTLNVEKTIEHAEGLLKEGLHGAFFFGSTGQSQLISLSEKKELISSIATNKNRKNFYLGVGCNSLLDTINLVKYSMEYKFDTFLLMPPAYYKNNTDKGIYLFFKSIIKETPKIKIILYNFEKLSGYLFSEKIIKKLKKDFPKNIIGVKDSSYNLYEKLRLDDFLIFPGSESKLLKGLELGCAGCISAITNVTHSLARKVFDDFQKSNPQTVNEKLISVRQTFDNFNLISSLHSFLSENDKMYLNLLPPLIPLTKEEHENLASQLKLLNFLIKKKIAA